MKQLNARAQVAERVRDLLGGEAVTERPRVVRWQPSRRALLGLAVVLVLVASLALAWVLSARPQPLTVASSGASPVAGDSDEGLAASTIAAPGGNRAGAGASGAAGAATRPATGNAPASGGATGIGTASEAAAEATQVVVDVAGKVRHPGLYRLNGPARVDDAITAAGGALPGVSLLSLNLAELLVDGEQILVGVTPSGAGAAGAGSLVKPASPGGGGGGATGQSGALVNLNTADVTALQQLPGVGPVTAEHIVQWRTDNGPFTSVSQLQQVSGIGPVKYAAMKDQATV